MSGKPTHPLEARDPGQTITEPMTGLEAAATSVDSSATYAEPMRFGGGDVEEVVQRHFAQIEHWAVDNQRDARIDLVRFWAFKLPAILGATATSALEASGLGRAVLYVGVISAICVAVDAIFPGGRLYNVHIRAFNELRLLGTMFATEWDRIRLEVPDASSQARANAAVRLLERIQKERQRIGNYIADGEAILGRGGDSGGRTQAR